MFKAWVRKGTPLFVQIAISPVLRLRWRRPHPSRNLTGHSFLSLWPSCLYSQKFEVAEGQLWEIVDLASLVSCGHGGRRVGLCCLDGYARTLLHTAHCYTELNGHESKYVPQPNNSSHFVNANGVSGPLKPCLLLYHFLWGSGQQ